MARRPRASPRAARSACSPREVHAATTLAASRHRLRHRQRRPCKGGGGATSTRLRRRRPSSTLRARSGRASFAGAGGAYATPHHRQLHPRNSTPGKFPVPRYYDAHPGSESRAMPRVSVQRVPFPSSGGYHGMAGSVPYSTHATNKGAREWPSIGLGNPKERPPRQK